MKLNDLDSLHVLKNSLEPISSSFLRTYGVLVGAEAFMVYEFLKTTDQNNFLIKNLSSSLAMNLSQVNTAIDILYQYELLDIKVNKNEHNHLRIQFKQALSSADFCRHDVLGRKLLKKIGAESFESLKRDNKDDLSTEGYSDYHCDDKIQNIQSWSNEDETQFNKAFKPKHQNQNLAFDLIAFLNECSPLVFPQEKRTELALSQITEIGAVYGLSVKQMIHLVGKACAKNDESLNGDKLRKLAAKVEVEESEEKSDPYDYPPALFLKRLRNGINPTNLEKYLLVHLVSKVGLKPEVLNVLLESHFKQYRSKINTKVLEEVAMQWAVLNIRTKEEAQQKVLETSSKGRRVEVKTDYAIKDHQLSEEELIALEMALKEIK